KFLDQSEQFTERMDSLIEQILRTASHPISLAETVARIRDKAGQWTNPEDPFVSYSLCYPVAAHLDHAAGHGRVKVTVSETGQRYAL
ncbi:MAG TPA: hypothetical protein VG722_03485, partial [Tepidisphaeraceae bacterium]|nr:hypothetical protein [Tepidisphaeraceae bacterium]